jgi:hypothetical protein
MDVKNKKPQDLKRNVLFFFLKESIHPKLAAMLHEMEYQVNF